MRPDMAAFPSGKGARRRPRSPGCRPPSGRTASTRCRHSRRRARPVRGMADHRPAPPQDSSRCCHRQFRPHRRRSLRQNRRRRRSRSLRPNVRRRRSRSLRPSVRPRPRRGSRRSRLGSYRRTRWREFRRDSARGRSDGSQWPRGARTVPLHRNAQSRDLPRLAPPQTEPGHDRAVHALSDRRSRGRSIALHSFGLEKSKGLTTSAPKENSHWMPRADFAPCEPRFRDDVSA